MVDKLNNLEVFFDYVCPYCYKAHKFLLELLPLFENVNVVWRPCESHPRPERYGPHSDLCIKGYYYILDKKLDVMEYHSLIYSAVYVDKIDIENKFELAEYISGFIDKTEFLNALDNLIYDKKLSEGNNYAYIKYKIKVVPSYRLNSNQLNSIENIGVTKEQIKDLLMKI